MYDTHTCSYHCKRLKCIEAQRDELRDKMDKLIAEAIAAEREACAKVCEDFQHIAEGMDKFHLTNAITAVLLGEGIARCADAIRARGEK